MQTRCPACQTLYRIDEDVLKRAGGQARCFRCDTVFNAYDHPASGPEPQEPLPADEAVEEQGVASLGMDTDSELSALADLPEVPEASGLAGPADVQEPLDIPDMIDSLHSRHTTPHDAVPDLEPGSSVDTPRQSAEPDDDLPFDMPADLPDIEPAEQEILSSDKVLPQQASPHKLRSWLGSLAALALTLTAFGQLAWFNRTAVLATPAGYTLAQGLCTLLDCTPPPRRAPSRFKILERNIVPAPHQQGVLAMRLSFSNGADFPQPLPDLQLSLYDNEEKLLARRRLHPREYLFPAPSDGTLVEPGATVVVDLQLEDPGRRASGFKLEFL
jgi:predicted Zn finger-like uncharacterized protein